MPAAEIRFIAITPFYRNAVISSYDARAAQYPTSPQEVTSNASRISRQYGAGEPHRDRRPIAYCFSFFFSI